MMRNFAAIVVLGAQEICDGVDNDGDGTIDDGLWDDVDGDGVPICYGDCDDTNPDVYPGAMEICDGILDNNCDGNSDLTEIDIDGDGYTQCDGDCDDSDASLTPLDNDGDGFSTCDGDCNDYWVAVYPGAPDMPGDGTDQNCDGMDGNYAKFVGESYYDLAGTSVASAGDVNGDGYDDILIGAPEDNEGGSNAGAAYLILGPVSGTIDLGTAHAKILGRSWSSAGTSVASAGDVNGDGYDDILIGAPTGSTGGRAFLVYGPVSGTVDLNGNANYFEFDGVGGSDAVGCSVAGVGDVNNDGETDILIGASSDDEGGESAGAAYLIYGPLSTNNNYMLLSDANIKFVGEDGDDRAGHSVASAGDVDGDGYSDILIGALGNQGHGAYLFYGPVNPGTVNLSYADAQFVGFDGLGVSVASAGDVDADGDSDILIGANYNAAGGTMAGAVYLFLGWPIGTVEPQYDADAMFYGENAYDDAGSYIASAGDVNGDGYDDILIGAPENDEGGQDAGAAYLILGPPPLGSQFPLSLADVKYVGEDALDNAGLCVAGAGDTSGFGYDEILIGAPYNIEGGNDAGAAYLITGFTTGTVDLY